MSPKKDKLCFQCKGCEFGQRPAELQPPAPWELRATSPPPCPAGSHKHEEKLVVPRVVPPRDVWWELERFGIMWEQEGSHMGYARKLD